MTHAATRHRQLDNAFHHALAEDGEADATGALVRARDRRKDMNTATTQPSTRVLLAELTECVSGQKKRYMRGYLGASNLVAFPGEPDEHGRPTWKLYLAERTLKPRP